MSLFQRSKYRSADPYADIDTSRLILRDHLAIDRTVLSNQNTFLAYIRTALTFVIAGLTFIKFFQIPAIVYLGWAFLPIGVATFVVGFIRYNRLRMKLARARAVAREKGLPTT